LRGINLKSLKRAVFIGLIFNFILITGTTFGQVKSLFSKVEQPSKSGGQIKIVQNKAIGTAVENYLWAQSKQKTIPGFRIRIFSNSGSNAKKEFENTKAGFLDVFDLKVYEEFQYPFYKIYVGDFRSRSEAMKSLVVIEKSYPDAFIVETKINYPKLRSE
jgi:hypothetical protein